MLKLFDPEVGREQNQYGEKLQTSYEHESRKHPLAGIRDYVEVTCLTGDACTEACVAHAGE